MNVINISHNIVIFSIITFFILIIIYNHCCSHYKEGLDLNLNQDIEVPYSSANINNEKIPVPEYIPSFRFRDMDITRIITNKDLEINPNESNYIDDATFEQMHTYPYCNKDGKGCENCPVKHGGRYDIQTYTDQFNDGTISLKEYIKIRDKAHLCPKNKASKSKVKKVSKSKNKQHSKSIERHKKKYMRQSKQFKKAKGRAQDSSKQGINDFSQMKTSVT